MHVAPQKKCVNRDNKILRKMCFYHKNVVNLTKRYLCPFFRGPTLKVDGRIYEYGLDRWTFERTHLC